MPPPLPLVSQLLKKIRNGAAVDIVSSSLALGFEDVVLRSGRVRSKGFCMLASWGGVEGVDGGEGLLDLG